MKDENIKEKVGELKTLVKEVNELMSDLDLLNVDVRIGYIERKGNVPQHIHLWRVEEHNNYLEE